MSEVYNKLFDRLAQHAERVFGPAAIHMALQEYFLWPEDEEAELDAQLVERHMTLFVPWFLFNWEYDPTEDEIELNGPPAKTVAELYAEERGPRLDSYERRVIEAVNRKPYSFYEALEVDSGRQILLQDVLSGRRVTVQERTGSQYIKPSDIVFGRVAEIDGIGMIMGFSPYVIPPGHKPMIIEFRGRMKGEAQRISDDVLSDWEFEIREFFLIIDRILFAGPKLCNTDGDPLEFHKIVFDIDSADDAFEKLVFLCVTTKASVLRKDAEKDADGHIRRAEITWDRKGHKAAPELSSTILGHIIIDGGRLTAEVNSARRAETIRKKIEAKLGAGARFRVDEISNLDKMMNDEKLMARAAERSAEHDALMQIPELRRHMAEMIRKHWENWVDMKLPALGGKTPRQAVLTGDGIEAVEALLVQAERTGERDPGMGEMNREGTRLVRALLGLRKPLP
ncbi:MAG: antitoxin Xre/MbcA/ParS toxin-binding domain-containing protein [Syntrophobacteraceae bacterium]